MFDKVYLEITNVCNLDCSFCHKTKRQKKLMTEEEFEYLTEKLRGKAKFLYFHLMGEPTLHPLLPKFIKIAKEKGFVPMLTTNGTLFDEKGKYLLENLPYKISISLHAPEANPKFADENYLKTCIGFAKQASIKGCIIALRLWNLGTEVNANKSILNVLHSEFSGKWVPIRGGSSLQLAPKLFLEWGEHFDWPDLNADSVDVDADVFCYGLRNHIGILVDGTVVPCCLDADGVISLGSLFDNELYEIVNSERAKDIYEGFTCRRAKEALCRRCGFARRFSNN